MIDAATHRKIAKRMGASWLYHGLLFNYPLCCISNFLVVAPSERNDEVPEEFKDTGFIPCPECAAKPAETIARINERTKRGIAPFPNAEV